MTTVLLILPLLLLRTTTLPLTPGSADMSFAWAYRAISRETTRTNRRLTTNELINCLRTIIYIRRLSDFFYEPSWVLSGVRAPAQRVVRARFGSCAFVLALLL